MKIGFQKIANLKRFMNEFPDAADKKSVEILIFAYHQNLTNLEIIKTSRESNHTVEPYDLLMLPFAICSFSSIYQILLFVKGRNSEIQTTKLTVISFFALFIFILTFTCLIVRNIKKEICDPDETVVSKVIST